MVTKVKKIFPLATRDWESKHKVDAKPLYTLFAYIQRQKKKEKSRNAI